MIFLVPGLETWSNRGSPPPEVFFKKGVLQIHSKLYTQPSYISPYINLAKYTKIPEDLDLENINVEQNKSES